MTTLPESARGVTPPIIKKNGRLVSDNKDGTVTVAIMDKTEIGTMLELIEIAAESIQEVINEASKLWEALSQIFRLLPDKIKIKDDIYSLMIVPAKGAGKDIAVYAAGEIKRGKIEMDVLYYGEGETEMEARKLLRKALELENLM